MQEFVKPKSIDELKEQYPMLLPAMSKALLEFYGDSGMTEQHIEDYTNLMLSGERPHNGPQVFIFNWLQKAKLV